MQLRVLRSPQFRASPPKFGRETYLGFLNFFTAENRLTLNADCRMALTPIKPTIRVVCCIGTAENKKKTDQGEMDWIEL